MYNVLSYAYVCLLVLILYIISQCMVMDHLKVMNVLNKTLNYESRLENGKTLRNLIIL